MTTRESNYKLYPAQQTLCPKCGKPPCLMAPDGLRNNGSAFWICWPCKSIAEIGKGPVEESKPDE